MSGPRRHPVFGKASRLPESSFRDPRIPEWNGQVLAQTRGLVEGDALALTGRGQLVHLGPLLPREPSTGRTHFRIPLYSGTGDGVGRFGIPVHPAFLRDADEVDHSADGTGTCVVRRSAPTDGARPAVLCRSLRDAGLDFQVRENAGGTKSVRIVSASQQGPWLDVGGSHEEQLRLLAWTWKKGPALDRLVLDLRTGSPKPGWRAEQEPITFIVVRLRPDLSLEGGRPWHFPPAVARVELGGGKR